jgi:hypothetical protein
MVVIINAMIQSVGEQNKPMQIFYDDILPAVLR